MKTKIGAVIMAGMFLVGTASVTMARGAGYNRGTAVRSGVGTQNRIGTQQRLRDGSCINPSNAGVSGAARKRGNTYGPGNGTGPYLPQDGTGYGAPANR